MGLRLLVTGAAPWVNSGYGKPWRYLLPRLHAAGHILAMAPFYGWRGTVSDTEVAGAPVKLYPPAKDQFSNDIIAFHAKDFDAEVVITMQDVWTLGGWGLHDFAWCPNFPVDTQPVAPVVLRAIEGCHTPMVNSRWAQNELIEHGWFNAAYVPYGVDTAIYAPRDKAAAREGMGLAPDKFIAGMVAANSSNPSRKSIPEVLLAWRRWLDAGNEGQLYIHTTITPSRNEGVDLQSVCENDELRLAWSTLDDPERDKLTQADVVFPSQYRQWAGACGDDELARAYNAMDVLLSPSQAEGFGIPIIEAQACGVPVVTLNITAMPEITFAGLCLEPMQPMWEAEGGWRGVAGVDDIRDALDWAAGLTDAERADLAETARLGAMNFDYDVEVERDWLPVLEAVENEKC